MENQNFSNGPIEREENFKAGTIAKSFLSNVFSYMSAALAITGIVAYWFGTDMSLLSLMFTAEGGMNMFGYFVMFAPLGLVLLMSARFHKLSSIGLVALFILFSVLMGMSLSSIFAIYTGSSIASTFFMMN